MNKEIVTDFYTIYNLPENIRFKYYSNKVSEEELKPYILCITKINPDKKVIKYNDKYYSWCSYNEKKKTYIYEEFEYKSESFFFDLNDDELITDNSLICPICGYAFMDSWELPDEAYEIECSQCNSILSYYTECTRTFYTKTIKKETPIEIKE